MPTPQHYINNLGKDVSDMSSSNITTINIDELLELSEVTDDDILVIQDKENTKKIRFINLVLNLVKDDDLPSTSKLFSSAKVYSLLVDYQAWVQEYTTGFNGRINNLESNSATIKFVRELYDALDEVKISEEDLEPLQQALSAKRSTSVPITADDLDTSSDEYKIHLKNLSTEVLDAMTGDTPINMASAPEGGWGSKYIADKAIIGTKLGPYYRYKGYITEGHVNDIIADGVYLVGSNVEGIPVHEDDIGTENKLLTVTRFGESGNYISQQVDYITNTELRPSYYKVGALNRIHSLEFESRYMVSDRLKISSEMMGDSYNDRGIIDSGNLYDTKIVGSYLVKAGVKNTPDTTKDFLVDIACNSNKYVYTAKDISKSQCLIYISLLYYDSNNSLVNTEWFTINTMNKSKFDGKKLVIFGDGISYGIGSTNINKLSIPALLGSNYGFNVVNNSIGDATVGEYQDTLLAQKSIINQIERCDSSVLGEYAIIFAGTNDYTSGKALIGYDDELTTNTFKGSLNLAIRNILSKNSLTKILLVTPMYRSRIRVGDGKNCDDNPVNNTYLRQYCTAMEEVAKVNHLPVLNLLEYGMINKYNYATYLEDGIHPNNNGHELVSNMIFDALSLYY